MKNSTSGTVVQEKKDRRLEGDWQEKAKVVKESNKQTDKATISSQEQP